MLEIDIKKCTLEELITYLNKEEPEISLEDVSRYKHILHIKRDRFIDLPLLSWWAKEHSFHLILTREGSGKEITIELKGAKEKEPEKTFEVYLELRRAEVLKLVELVKRNQEEEWNPDYYVKIKSEDIPEAYKVAKSLESKMFFACDKILEEIKWDMAVEEKKKLSSGE